MSTAPFYFSVVSEGVPTRSTWLETAREAEDLGFDSLLVTDHLHQSLAPIPALAAAAVVTRRLRLGTFVLCHDLRNPAVLARELIALDVLSDGRLEIGLGAGWFHGDYAVAGLELPSGAVRLERFREACRIVQGALERSDFAFEGIHHRTRGDDSGLRPIQSRPPLMIAGARRQMLAFAAQAADRINFGLRSLPDGTLDERSATPEALERKLAWVREAAGERFDALVFGHVLWDCCVTPNPEPILEIFARGYRCEPSRLGDYPGLLIGSVGQVAEQLQARRARWRLSHVTIPAAAMRAFAPVLSRLKT